MTKQKVYEEELVKLTEIFKDVDESKKKLVEGLIQDAAFLYAENYYLRKTLDKTGMIKIHPEDPTRQKDLPAANEFRKNLNIYAVVIKVLNGVLQKVEDDDDDMGEYE